MSENRMETVTLSRARHDAIENELSQLRILRVLLASRFHRSDRFNRDYDFIASDYDLENLRKQAATCHAMYEKTAKAAAEGHRLTPKELAKAFAEADWSRPKLDYDRMPHDFEELIARRTIQEASDRLSEIGEYIENTKCCEEVTQAILRELEASRRYIDDANDVIKKHTVFFITGEPKREVTIQRELPPRDGDHFVYSARLRK